MHLKNVGTVYMMQYFQYERTSYQEKPRLHSIKTVEHLTLAYRTLTLLRMNRRNHQQVQLVRRLKVQGDFAEKKLLHLTLKGIVSCAGKYTEGVINLPPSRLGLENQLASIC